MSTLSDSGTTLRVGSDSPAISLDTGHNSLLIKCDFDESSMMLAITDISDVIHQIGRLITTVPCIGSGKLGTGHEVTGIVVVILQCK